MKTIFLLCTLFLSACSSVPLATMLHFSDAKPDDFFTVDPQGILVKVSINSMVHFDPIHSINLSANIKDNAGERTIVFPLELVDKITQVAVEGFFNNIPAFDIYILKLSPKAITNLKVLHKEKSLGINKRVGLTAGINLSKCTGNSDLDIDENTVLSVALKLKENSEFITLIDNWKVEAGISKS
jgi:hypothetical protein